MRPYPEFLKKLPVFSAHGAIFMHHLPTVNRDRKLLLVSSGLVQLHKAFRWAHELEGLISEGAFLHREAAPTIRAAVKTWWVGSQSCWVFISAIFGKWRLSEIKIFLRS